MFIKIKKVIGHQHAGGQAMRTLGHFIGGKAVRGTSGRQGEIYRPVTGEVAPSLSVAASSVSCNTMAPLP